jgi:DNA-binding NtrC family response regulator
MTGANIFTTQTRLYSEDLMTLQPYPVPIPASNHAASNHAASNNLSANPQPLSQSQTILLVEDEPFVRDATSSILRHAGFEILAVADVADAVKAFTARQAHISLVMTDLVLPGGTGQQLAHDLRQLSPTLPVLVTSGYTHAECETETPASLTYFLAKPYSRRSLLDKIEQILAQTAIAHPETQAG